jgi:hypothetical protein
MSFQWHPARRGTHRPPVQVKAAQGDESLLVPYAVLETTFVPWLVQNEKALERAGFHTLMRAFRAFDSESKGYIDANVLKTALSSKVLVVHTRSSAAGGTVLR